MPKKSSDWLDTEWLKTFLVVFPSRSHTQAATILNCSQSTVTNHIAKLETWLRAPLFSRVDYGSEPTKLAWTFEEKARGVLLELEKLGALRAEAIELRVTQPIEQLPDDTPEPAPEQTADRGWWKRTFGG